MYQNTDDLRIVGLRPLLPPAILIEEIPVSTEAAATVTAARQQITDIIAGQDDRLLVVVGPCSIHDPAAALDYARHLKEYADRLRDTLCIIMRVYLKNPARRSAGRVSSTIPI
jgi:3-deoxy-7-phosphoheptulonate synthase